MTKTSNVRERALKYVTGLFMFMTLSLSAICSTTTGVRVLTLVQDGDTLNLIEERHLDSLAVSYEQAIRNLESRVTEYAIQVDIHRGNATRYEQIAANDSRIVALQTGMIAELHSKVKRMKFKAVMGTALGFAIGVLLVK